MLRLLRARGFCVYSSLMKTPLSTPPLMPLSYRWGTLSGLGWALGREFEDKFLEKSLAAKSKLAGPKAACFPGTINGFAESPLLSKKTNGKIEFLRLRGWETQTNQRAEKPAGGHRWISEKGAKLKHKRLPWTRNYGIRTKTFHR